MEWRPSAFQLPNQHIGVVIFVKRKGCCTIIKVSKQGLVCGHSYIGCVRKHRAGTPVVLG